MQKEFSFNETYKIFEKKYKEKSYGLLGELSKNNIKEKLKQEKENLLLKVRKKSTLI